MATTKKKAGGRKKSAAKTKAVSRARGAPRRAAPAQENTASAMHVSQEERWRMIALAAYHKAERRAFKPGREVDDWLEAEREVDALLGRRET